MGILGGLWEAVRLCVKASYVFTRGFAMGAGAPYFLIVRISMPMRGIRAL